MKKKFIHCGPYGREIATLLLEPFHSGSYWLQLFNTTPAESIAVPEHVVLVSEAVSEARQQRAVDVLYRTVEEGDWQSLAFRLEQLGFTRKNRRIEFRAELSALPNELGSPLSWSALAPIGIYSEEQAAEAMKQASVGDPDSDPEEDALSALRGFLADSVLTSGPHCVQVGTFGGSIAALVIAQINPKTGWSRITYMGILPRFRRQRLGKWVHRHGFTMMREQGGKIYHGGTLAENQPMLKLFQAHGCQEHRRMQEWIYKF